MKHPLSTTAMLILLFVAAQIVGISLLALNIKTVDIVQGKTVVVHDTTALGDRPQTTGSQSFWFIIIGVLIGTGLLLLLIKFRIYKLWKLWFLLAVWFSTTVAFGVVLPTAVALILSLGLAVWKIYWPNPVVHNLTEIFMYSGLAVLLAPLFTLFWIIMLLLVISVYDMIAVWQSKHMVVMARAQMENSLFAGFYIPTITQKSELKALRHPSSPKSTAETITKEHTRPLELVADRKSGSGAILGGGDIVFPLLFSGVVMDWLIAKNILRSTALYETLIITATSAIALTLLFYYAKKDKFYPAMPFVTLGCLTGLSIIFIISLI